METRLGLSSCRRVNWSETSRSLLTHHHSSLLLLLLWDHLVWPAASILLFLAEPEEGNAARLLYPANVACLPQSACDVFQLGNINDAPPPRPNLPNGSNQRCGKLAAGFAPVEPLNTEVCVPPQQLHLPVYWVQWVWLVVVAALVVPHVDGDGRVEGGEEVVGTWWERGERLSVSLQLNCNFSQAV